MEVIIFAIQYIIYPNSCEQLQFPATNLWRKVLFSYFYGFVSHMTLSNDLTTRPPKGKGKHHYYGQYTAICIILGQMSPFHVTPFSSKIFM